MHFIFPAKQRCLKTKRKYFDSVVLKKDFGLFGNQNRIEILE